MESSTPANATSAPPPRAPEPAHDELPPLEPAGDTDDEDEPAEDPGAFDWRRIVPEDSVDRVGDLRNAITVLCTLFSGFRAGTLASSV